MAEPFQPVRHNAPNLLRAERIASVAVAIAEAAFNIANANKTTTSAAVRAAEVARDAADEAARLGRYNDELFAAKARANTAYAEAYHIYETAKGIVREADDLLRDARAEHTAVINSIKEARIGANPISSGVAGAAGGRRKSRRSKRSKRKTKRRHH